MQARDERLDPSALFFERGAGGKVKVDGEGGEQGFDFRFSIEDLRMVFQIYGM